MLSYKEFTEELVHQIPDYLPAEFQERGLEVQPFVAINDTQRDVLTPAGTPTFKKRKKAAFLLIFFLAWNIIKSQLEAANRYLPP